MKVRDIIAKITAAGWRLDRQKGSHRQFTHPVLRGVVTVSGHLGDDVFIDTLKSMERQSQMRLRD